MIKGLKPAMAEAGKIKIGKLGEERRGGNGTYRLPVKLDHFLVTKPGKAKRSDDFEVDVAIMQSLKPDQDGHVRDIPIILHSDNIDEVFPTAMVMYAGNKLACSGDGENAIRYKFDGKVRTDETVAKKCEGCKYKEPLEKDEKKRAVCKPHGTLHCSINIEGQAVAGAVYKWRTTSIISVQRMLGSLEQIGIVAGTLQGIPLTLCVRPITVTPNGITSTVHVCHVELRAKDITDILTKALEARRVRGLLGPANADYSVMVEVPGQEPEDEQVAIAAEFHPVEPEPEPAKVDGDATAEVTSTAVATVENAEVVVAGGPPGAGEDVDYGSPDGSGLF